VSAVIGLHRTTPAPGASRVRDDRVRLWLTVAPTRETVHPDPFTRSSHTHMKNMLNEFKDFINKGDVVTIAVGLVLALYFKTIVDKFIEGVITPIIAAIAGKESYTQIGFDLGDARISIGLVIGAVIDFIIVAFVLFLVVKAYNTWKKPDEAEAGPTEIDLLTEIRDSLRNR
jgi:large conductance mechanosensitive channel